MRTLLVCVVIVVSACVQSNAVQCGFGLCAPGARCDEANGKCIASTCGNGVLDGDEQCDCGSANGMAFSAACATTGAADCTDFGFYFDGGLACTPECSFDTTSCKGACGDLKINGPEACDGLPPPGQSCSDFGYDYGRLACSPLCGAQLDTCGQIGWRTEIGSAVDELVAVWGATGSDLYAVGGAGSILHSDGGAWTAMTQTATTLRLMGVWGSGTNDVYAVGGNTQFAVTLAWTILHYDGNAWSAMTLPNVSARPLRAISGRAANDIFAAGAQGTVLHFDGTSWTQLSVALPAPAPDLYGAWATTDGVYVVGAIPTGPAAYYLPNGASAWQTITLSGMPAAATTLNAVSGVGTHVYAGGNEGMVFESTVGATTWTQPTNVPVTTLTVYGVWASSSTDVYFVGDRGLALHDNGSHIESFLITSGRTIQGIFGFGPGNIQLAIKDGTLEAFDGTSWTQVQTVGNPSGYLHSLSADASGHLVAVGELGVVLESDPASPTGWTADTPITGSPTLLGVWSSSDGSQVVFAGSTATGGVWRRDATTSGTFVQDLSGFQYFAVWGAGVNDVYVAGGTPTQGAIHHWNGSTWTGVTIPTGVPRLTSIWGSGPNDIYASGWTGTVVHSTDGITWTQTQPPLSPLNPTASTFIWGTSATDVWLGGTGGSIAHFDGTSWRHMFVPSNADVLNFAGRPSDVYALCAAAVLHFDGTSWSAIQEPGSFASGAGVLLRDELVMIGGIGQALSLYKPKLTSERHCQDGFDDNQDGLVDCADPTCDGTLACARGGACPKVAHLFCNQTVAATTYSGIARIDDLPCLDHSTPGPEIGWELSLPDGGPVTVTATKTTASDPGIDVVIAPAYASGGCDLSMCTAVSGNAISFTAAAATPYYVLVDGDQLGAGADFTLSVSCP